ncbi:hypothetical protein FIU87_07365 [Bacillus sp. THAF10]|nr:hypothetical protein FIU87_07365 [Bacillus sp. THAF10]
MGVVYVECKKKCKCYCCCHCHFHSCFRDEEDDSFVAPRVFREERSSNCGCGFYDDEDDD